MTLPHGYAWLANEPGPKMLLEALKLHGVHEAPGSANDATIMGWAAECGLKASYTADSIPWCGLFMAVVARRAGKPVPRAPLWALSWSAWGLDAGQPELGDVLTFVRPGGGHVALYVGEDRESYHVLGGNQSDRVSFARLDKQRMRAARRPIWQVAEPPNRRPVLLTAMGALSRDEA